MSGRLIMCKGLPASGKSTFADEFKARDPKGVVVVTKDDIRAELNRKSWNFDVEKEVLRLRDFRICEGLSKGLVVISADTNLAVKHELRLRELAKKYKADFTIQSFLDVPLLECLRRDREREFPVGDKVIVRMAEDFLIPSDLIERTGTPQLFLDLDGVLADFDGFVSKEFGIENNREHERPDFWDIVRGYAGRLYYDMDRLPQATELFSGLKPYNPIILTGCPWSIPTAAADKRQWVAENIDPDVQVVCCSARNKCLYGKSGDILVDDWTKHKPRWETMGGVWVTYSGNVDETITRVKELLPC